MAGEDVNVLIYVIYERQRALAKANEADTGDSRWACMDGFNSNAKIFSHKIKWPNVPLN